MVDLEEIFRPAKVFVVAEVGINHNGDVDKLVKLVEKSKQSGADAVKFQIFSKSLFYLPKEYLPEEVAKNLPLDVFKKSFITWEKYSEVFAYSREIGILPFATPLDIESFEFLEGLGVEVFKVASSDINYIPLLRRISKTKKLVMISTGFSPVEEVKRYSALLRNNPLVIMFCVSRYPSLPKDISIREFLVFRRVFENFPRRRCVGFSDHTKTISLPVAMASLGAKVIEKHITLDENDDSYDNSVSISPEKFSNMVEMIREVEQSLSVSSRNLPSKASRTMSMRSLVARKEILAGTIISEELIEALRPSIFLESSLRNWKKILNKKSSRHYSPMEPL